MFIVMWIPRVLEARIKKECGFCWSLKEFLSWWDVFSHLSSTSWLSEKRIKL